MKETESWEILVSLSANEISLAEAHDQILRLFNVVGQSELLCDNPNCEDGIVDYDYYKNPIYCQVCDKHN